MRIVGVAMLVVALIAALWGEDIVTSQTWREAAEKVAAILLAAAYIFLAVYWIFGP